MDSAPTLQVGKSAKKLAPSMNEQSINTLAKSNTINNDNGPEDTTPIEVKVSVKEKEKKNGVETKEDEANKDKEEQEETQVKGAPPKRKRLSCKDCCKKCCPYFPRCCPLPLQNCLQILAIVDLVVACVNIGLWLYLHQYDPFALNDEASNKTDYSALTTEIPVKMEGEVDPSSIFPAFNPSDFHETTTSSYGKDLIGANFDISGDGIKYSRIGYAFRRYQQEVENMCGRKYYGKFLLGHGLTLTNGVFLDLLTINYITELLYQFIDVSILVTTCCYFEYVSGRFFLIILWNMELLPVLGKIYLCVESRSHRLCILQYGLGHNFHGLDALLIYHFVPLIIFRAYVLLVFTFYVNSLLELGNLEHQTRIQGRTLQDYVNKHNEFMRMDKYRGQSSSEDDDIDLA